MSDILGVSFDERREPFATAVASDLATRFTKLLAKTIEVTPEAAAAGPDPAHEGILVTGILVDGGARASFSAFFDQEAALSLATAAAASATNNAAPAEDASSPQNLAGAVRAFIPVAGEVVEAIVIACTSALDRSPRGEIQDVRAASASEFGSLNPATAATVSLRLAGAAAGTMTVTLGVAGESLSAATPADGETGESDEPVRPSDALLDLDLPFSLRLGSVELDLGTIREIQPGSAIPLEAAADGQVQLVVGGRVIGRGQLVVVDGCFGIKVDSVETAERRLKSLARA